MSGRFGRRVLARLFATTLVVDASAETVAKTARKWGLIGPWSLDCSLKPDRDRGTVLAYEIVGDDRVVFRRNFGDSSDESEVVTAEISADRMLNLRVFFPSLRQTRESGQMKQSDGSMRTMYDRSLQGGIHHQGR